VIYFPAWPAWLWGLLVPAWHWAAVYGMMQLVASVVGDELGQARLSCASTAPDVQREWMLCMMYSCGSWMRACCHLSDGMACGCCGPCSRYAWHGYCGYTVSGYGRFVALTVYYHSNTRSCSSLLPVCSVQRLNAWTELMHADEHQDQHQYTTHQSRTTTDSKTGDFESCV
jgi:hypothetical protein